MCTRTLLCPLHRPRPPGAPVEHADEKQEGQHLEDLRGGCGLEVLGLGLAGEDLVAHPEGRLAGLQEGLSWQLGSILGGLWGLGREGPEVLGLPAPAEAPSLKLPAPALLGIIALIGAGALKLPALAAAAAPWRGRPRPATAAPAPRRSRHRAVGGGGAGDRRRRWMIMMMLMLRPRRRRSGKLHLN